MLYNDKHMKCCNWQAGGYQYSTKLMQWLSLHALNNSAYHKHCRILRLSVQLDNNSSAFSHCYTVGQWITTNHTSTIFQLTAQKCWKYLNWSTNTEQCFIQNCNHNFLQCEDAELWNYLTPTKCNQNKVKEMESESEKKRSYS